MEFLYECHILHKTGTAILEINADLWSPKCTSGLPVIKNSYKHILYWFNPERLYESPVRIVTKIYHQTKHDIF